MEVAVFVITNINLTSTSETTKRAAQLRNKNNNVLNQGGFKKTLLTKSIMCVGPMKYNKIPENINNQDRIQKVFDFIII